MTETNLILTEITASISEFKKNPMGIIAAGEGFPIAILNRNKPAFYCIPAHAFEVMMEKIEDYELNVIADSRKDQPEIEVTLGTEHPAKGFAEECHRQSRVIVRDPHEQEVMDRVKTVSESDGWTA